MMLINCPTPAPALVGSAFNPRRAGMLCADNLNMFETCTRLAHGNDMWDGLLFLKLGDGTGVSMTLSISSTFVCKVLKQHPPQASLVRSILLDFSISWQNGEMMRTCWRKSGRRPLPLKSALFTSHISHIFAYFCFVTFCKWTSSSETRSKWHLFTDGSFIYSEG